MAEQKTIKSSQFGEVQIDVKKIIKFPEGILGFEELKKYVLLNIEDFEPFQWLVSFDDPEISFPLVSPLIIDPKYSPEIKKGNLKVLKGFEEKDLLLFVVVTIRKEANKVTANLRAPIVINEKTKLGIQTILDDEELSASFQFL